MALGAATLLLYLPTVSPGVEGGDPGEFQIVPYVLGIPHQTGYPLYVLLGKLWTLLPMGSIAYRINFLSTVFAALTSSLTFLTVRTLGAGRIPSAIGGLAFALSPLFWFWSTLAGVRSMAVFFFALLIWLALAWRAQLTQGPRSERWLDGLALCLGLALTHHRTIVLAMPALALLMLWTRPPLRVSLRRLPRLALLSLSPLLLYLYLWIRGSMDPPLEVFPVVDLGSFMNLILAPSAVQDIVLPSPGELPRLSYHLLQGIASQFTVMGIVLGAMGVWRMRHRLPELAFLSFIFGATAIFAIVYGGYGLASLQRELIYFLLPTYLVFAIWIGLGADSLWRGLTQWHPDPSLRYFGGALLVTAISWMFFQQAHTSYQSIEQARGAPLDLYRQALRGEAARRMAVSSLRQADPGAIVLSDWEQFTALRYYQLVEGWRPDLYINYPIDGWPEWLERARAEGRAFYLTRHLPEVVGQRFLTSEGPLVRLQTRASHAIPEDSLPAAINFGDELELIGYSYLQEGRPARAPRLRPGSVLSAVLYWRPKRPLAENYSISIRLLDSSDQPIASVDNLHPVLSLYPTSLWEPGEIVSDYYELLLPPGAAPGPYRLAVVVYQTAGEGRLTNLSIVGTDPPQEMAVLAPFSIPGT